MATDILNESSPEPETKKRHKKVPGIYKRGSRYQIDATYKGIRIQERCVTFEMAESALRKQKTLIDEGRYLDKKKEANETLEQLGKRYLTFCEGQRQKSLTSKRTNVEKIVEHFGKETLVCKIGRVEVEDYQTALSATNAERKETALKPASINRRMACLRHMMSKAVEWKILSAHPCHGVKQFKENNQRVRFLTAEECQTLIGACQSATLGQIVELALNTGMRKGELIHLERDHINLRQGYLEILNQKNGEYDTIPLNERALEILKSIPPRLDSKYVFPGKIPGRPFYDLKGQFEKAVKDSKLERVTFHTLRHTAASHMVMNGVPLPTVKEILRHKDYSTTLRYSHLSPEHRKSAVDVLGEALKPKPKEEAKTA
jgi:integrase